MKPDLVTKLLLTGIFLLLLALVFNRPALEPARAQGTTADGVTAAVFKDGNDQYILLATATKWRVLGTWPITRQINSPYADSGTW